MDPRDGPLNRLGCHVGAAAEPGSTFHIRLVLSAIYHAYKWSGETAERVSRGVTEAVKRSQSSGQLVDLCSQLAALLSKCSC